MEIRSGDLSASQLHSEITCVMLALSNLKIKDVEVEHWFGKENVNVSNLDKVLLEGMEDYSSGSTGRKVRLGDSDFILKAPGVDIVFVFCHEDELHIITTDQTVADKFLERWKASGYHVMIKS